MGRGSQRVLRQPSYSSLQLPCPSFRGLSSTASRASSDTEEEGAASATAASAPAADLSFEFVRVDVEADGKVGVVTLARPERLNALSEGVMREVLAALFSLDAREEIGAMVITGEGKAFAAGADISEMAKLTFADAHKRNLLGGWDDIRKVKKPIIAAVNGYALGGGCELAMMCDIILINKKAVFGQPEVKLGVTPGMGGTQRLPKAVGKSRAMEMILTGEYFMGAEEAVRSGLASRMVDGDYGALREEAINVGKKISALSQPAVALAKQSVNASFDNTLVEGICRERSLFHASFALGDQKEGMGAFLEKRIPRFSHS